MALVVLNTGKPLLISLLFKDAAVPALPWYLVLYKNNFTPLETSVLADFTEATFTGYSPEELTRATWQAPAMVANKALIQYGTGPITWTATAAFQTIYGYLIFQGVTNTGIIAERFATPIDLSLYPVAGVLPRVTLATDCGC